jgi:hypothetical protein
MPASPNNTIIASTNDGSEGSEGKAPYTAAEEKWLEVVWGGEIRFLIEYRLSPFKEEDREQGRAIVRALFRREEERERAR